MLFAAPETVRFLAVVDRLKREERRKRREAKRAKRRVRTALRRLREA